jgi:hypothetical protein
MIGTSHKLADISAAITRQPCARPVYEVILHHTWAPTIAQYKGKSTIDGIHRYHTVENGWSDIGYHCLISPDGLLWLGRPLAKDGAHVLNHNTNTVGVSMIMNGDVELPTAAQVASTTACLKALLSRFKIAPEKNFRQGHGFHRDYSSKTCPGTKISKAMVLGWLTQSADPVDAEPDDGGDVPSWWAAEDVAWAEAEGIITGGRPHDPVTREELAIVARRLLERHSSV